MITDKDILEYLERDYVRKIEQLHRHLSSIWTRFNFFITFEGLIIGAKFLSFGGSGDASGTPKDFQFGICFLGLVTSFIWYCFSANDRYLVKLYRNHVEDAFCVLQDYLKKRKANCLLHENYDMSLSSKRNVKSNIFGWRWSKLGLTDYATMLPMAITIFWIMYICHCYSNAIISIVNNFTHAQILFVYVSFCSDILMTFGRCICYLI